MIKAICRSDKGLCRSHNEDSYCLNGQAFQDEDFSYEGGYPLLACVFDGVGGASCGEKISFFCAGEMASSGQDDFLSEESLRRRICEINKAALREFGENKSGSTLAGVYFKEDKAVVFNVGDSRVYRASSGLTMQYSTDDTLARDESVDRSHAITNYFGSPFLSEESVHYRECSWLPGDILLICSDGVSDFCDVEKILSSAPKGEDLTIIAKEIEGEVFARGAKDNFTFILIQDCEGETRHG